MISLRVGQGPREIHTPDVEDLDGQDGRQWHLVPPRGVALSLALVTTSTCFITIFEDSWPIEPTVEDLPCCPLAPKVASALLLVAMLKDAQLLILRNTPPSDLVSTLPPKVGVIPYVESAFGLELFPLVAGHIQGHAASGHIVDQVGLPRLPHTNF